MNEEKGIEALLVKLGFKSKAEFTGYMIRKSSPMQNSEFYCYTEKRQGYTLNYSGNCTHVFGIGGYVKGMFQDCRFNG